MVLFTGLMLSSCVKYDYEIEYQEGYPNVMADNWVAFEFQGGDHTGDILEPYNLVTSPDPNRAGYLIFDKLYNADIRVRAELKDTTFSVEYGENLEQISEQNFGIEYISLEGYLRTDLTMRSFTYDLANAFFSDMDFYLSNLVL